MITPIVIAEVTVGFPTVNHQVAGMSGRTVTYHKSSQKIWWISTDLNVPPFADMPKSWIVANCTDVQSRWHFDNELAQLGNRSKCGVGKPEPSSGTVYWPLATMDQQIGDMYFKTNQIHMAHYQCYLLHSWCTPKNTTRFPTKELTVCHWHLKTPNLSKL